MTLAAIPALVATGLRAGYGRGGDIVAGVDLTVPPESILAVVGPNGSGKSTLIKALAGLLPLRAGRIALTGTDVSALTAARRAAAGIAYVPQEANVFRTMTVQENLKLATEFLRGRPGVGPDREARVMALFPEIAARRRDVAGNLSGGQRQMLAFACALLANPELLLLDEPSAGLSPKLVGEIMQSVRRARNAGVTVVLVEQNVKAALEIADAGLVLVGGRVRHAGAAAALRDADFGDLFLGRAA